MIESCNLQLDSAEKMIKNQSEKSEKDKQLFELKVDC